MATSRSTKRDNSTLRQKVWLRDQVREALTAPPVVLETHGGLGEIWARCWSDTPPGIVIEKDAGRAAHLASQRPTWAVYQTSAPGALARGLGAHRTIDVLDVDPYGDPWPTIAAFFASERPFTPRMHVVVNDGLRNATRRRIAWKVETLKPVVEQLGNDLYGRYLEACRLLMTAAIAPAGYKLSAFKGYYTGHGQDMTHYWATVAR